MSGSFASEQRFDTEARAHSRRLVPSPGEPLDAFTSADDLHAGSRVERSHSSFNRSITDQVHVFGVFSSLGV